MKLKYDVEELCEKILKVGVPTFNRHKDKYMEKLKGEYHVEIEIGAYGKKYYILEPKESVAILRDVIAENSKLTNKNLKNIELILKAVLIDKVLPIPEEIAKNIELSESTIKRTIAKMRDNHILLEPNIEIVQTVNKYTGEIFEYERKKHSYIYYDISSAGDRTIINLSTIHNAFGEFFSEKINELMHQHKHRFNYEIAKNVANTYTWKQMNLTFDMRNGNRTKRWIVSSEYQKMINEKYGCHQW